MSRSSLRTSGRQAADRRQRAAAARAAAARAAERRTRTLRYSRYAAGAAIVAGAVAAVLVSQHGSGSSTASTTRGIAAAGLRLSTMAPGGAHFHPHLDILVAGKAVPVAANIGIIAATGQMSELHTHDDSGVLHVEAPDKARRYVLGQLFGEWNVRLDTAHLGGLTASGGNTLSAYVDGQRVTGNPGAIELRPHREIARVRLFWSDGHAARGMTLSA